MKSHEEDDVKTLSHHKSGVETQGQKKQINLAPNGLIGVIFIITFFLICFMYFGMILQTGNFNPKIVA